MVSISTRAPIQVARSIVAMKMEALPNSLVAAVARYTVFGWSFFRAFSRAASIPSGDPLLTENLHYHYRIALMRPKKGICQ